MNSNLQKYSWGILAIILTIFVIVGTIAIAPSVLENDEVTSIELDFDVHELIDVIVSDLEDNLITENGNPLGWYYQDGIPESKIIYNGFLVGTAGIVDFLFTLYQENLLDNTAILNTSIQILLDQAIQTSNGILWSKTPIYGVEGWTAMRYGSIGIMKVLSRLYVNQYGFDNLTIIEEGFRWLLNNQEEDTSYAITPGSYITTDYEYGAAGIGLGLLSIYDDLKSEMYLQEAERIADWIINSGFWKGAKFNIPWTPFGEYSEFEDKSYASYSSGLAGIMDFMNQLFLITQNEKYSQIVFGLVNFLMATEHGGQWGETAVDYIIKAANSKGTTGLFTGSSGIALEFLHLYDQIRNETYLELAATCEKYVNNYIEDDGSVKLSSELDRHYTGYASGAIGVAQYHLELYQRYGQQRNIEHATKILNHIVELYQQAGYILIDEDYERLGYSYSLEDGITGLGVVLVSYLNLESKNLEDAYTSYFDQVEIEQDTDDSTTIMNLLGMALLMTIFAVYQQRKKLASPGT